MLCWLSWVQNAYVAKMLSQANFTHFHETNGQNIVVIDFNTEQECIRVGCIPPASVATEEGSLSPFTETPFTEITLPRDPSPDRDPQERTWDQAARQEVTSYRDPRGQTDTCKNSTLPQTSFAGGNNFTIRIR